MLLLLRRGFALLLSAPKTAPPLPYRPSLAYRPSSSSYHSRLQIKAPPTHAAQRARARPRAGAAAGSRTSLEDEDSGGRGVANELELDDGGQQPAFMAAVALIVGTAVGPGILALPAATIAAGLIPSSISILASWAYVLASILLVAELSFNLMQEQCVDEVSFTGLALHTLGRTAGCLVAAVYAILNYALLVACVAGIGSILQRWLPFLPPPVPFLLCPTVVGAMATFFPFKIVDNVNRSLCFLMLISIASLVALGLCFGRESLLSSWAYGVWSAKALLPAIPVTVLTLGFHVITPVVCRLIGRPEEARKAILCGGLVPLIMVLAWNAVVLGLAPRTSGSVDPLQLLLSVSSFAGPAVQAFAFAALGTTLIGYALSFPKQLSDTLTLFSNMECSSLKPVHSNPDNQEGDCLSTRTDENPLVVYSSIKGRNLMLILALGPPALASIIHPAAFASALDFAGVYANCFLFGILPPLMAWCYRYGTLQRAAATNSMTLPLVPGGRMLLLVLFIISAFLGLRPPSSTN